MTAAGDATAILAGLLAAALVAILLVRRWLATYPFGLPAPEVAENDPILREAEARARRTLPDFLRLLPLHPGRAYVRFAFPPDGGETEHLWARVEGYAGGVFAVRVETPPAAHEGPFEAERAVPRDAVEDWQVEMDDGTIRGGFTLHALFDIWRRERGELPGRWAALEARYVDCTKVAQ